MPEHYILEPVLVLLRHSFILPSALLSLLFLSFSPQHLRILRSFSKILGSCGKRKEEKERRIAKLILELKQIPVTYEGISFANQSLGAYLTGNFLTLGPIDSRQTTARE